MDIEEYMKKRHRKNNFDDSSNEEKKINYLKFLVTRILISIIFVISVSIYIKLDTDNILLVDKYLFQESLEFTKINNWYKEHVGELIPEISDNTEMVFSSSELKMMEYENYMDGVKLNISKSSPVSILYGGIVVYIGEKEGYGNTLILQGNDGIDYWYGGLSNISVNLYDYLEKDTLIGETEKDYLYIVLEKDGKYLNYEDI